MRVRLWVPKAAIETSSGTDNGIFFFKEVLIQDPEALWEIDSPCWIQNIWVKKKKKKFKEGE